MYDKRGRQFLLKSMPTIIYIFLHILVNRTYFEMTFWRFIVFEQPAQRTKIAAFARVSS